MSDVLYVQLNVMCIVILLMMLFHMRKKRSKSRMTDQRLFNILILINLCILIMDIFMWVLDGTMFPLAHTLYLLFTMLYYILNCSICFIWVLYTDYKLHANTKNLVKKLKVLLIPLFVFSIMSILSVWTGWFFLIDELNVYMRGPWYFFMLPFTFGYAFYSFILIYYDQQKRGWKNRQNLYCYLLIFPLIVLCSAIVQSFVYGLSIIWTCSSLSLLAIFINIQNNEINTDYLTGLNNRKCIDEFMKAKIQNKGEDSVFFVIVIDVDDFKYINDTYGHSVGDRILVKMSEIFKISCAKNGDLVVRLGGDEFMIAGERTSVVGLHKLLGIIDRLLMNYNDNNDIYETVSLSIGYAIYTDQVSTVDKLMNLADENMYKIKRNKHKREKI